MVSIDELEQELKQQRKRRDERDRKINISRESQQDLKRIQLKRKNLQREINALRSPKRSLFKSVLKQIGKDITKTTKTGVKAARLIKEDLAVRNKKFQLQEKRIAATKARIAARKKAKRKASSKKKVVRRKTTRRRVRRK